MYFGKAFGMSNLKTINFGITRQIMGLVGNLKKLFCNITFVVIIFKFQILENREKFRRQFFFTFDKIRKKYL